jgi:hypothetical protein
MQAKNKHVFVFCRIGYPQAGFCAGKVASWALSHGCSSDGVAGVAVSFADGIWESEGGFAAMATVERGLIQLGMGFLF